MAVQWSCGAVADALRSDGRPLGAELLASGCDSVSRQTVVNLLLRGLAGAFGIDSPIRYSRHAERLGRIYLKLRYNTNLAAEFHVLSILHRKGLDANLTLGNKKSVDIVIVRDVGDDYTIDVKGLAGKTGWPVDNVRAGKRRHFLVFVCFLDAMEDANIIPEVYVVPSTELEPLIYPAPGGRKLIQLCDMRGKGKNLRDGSRFKDAWGLLK